jgi:hypothetical protein
LTLEDKLRTYREKTARIAILELEIQGLEAEIKLSTGIQETDAETIEGMAYRRSLEGGTGGDNSSKTERVAMNFKQEQDKLSKPQDVSFLYGEIRKRQGELKRLQEETLPIGMALDGLNPKEKLIIEDRCIDNYTWQEVTERWKATFGYHIAERTCKNIKWRAYEKLKRILGA